MIRAGVILCFVFLVCTAEKCSNKLPHGTYRGKLVIKELCAHYVVQIVEGSADTSKVSNNWKDEKRNTTYNKVFTVANRCKFPADSLKEGSEFEFVFDTLPPPEDCMVCMAYYPTPSKMNVIRVVKIK